MARIISGSPFYMSISDSKMTDLYDLKDVSRFVIICE